jgi:integrase
VLDATPRAEGASLCPHDGSKSHMKDYDAVDGERPLHWSGSSARVAWRPEYRGNWGETANGRRPHPRVVMETLGHSQISLTLDTYSHVLPALGAEAATKMDLLVGVKQA